MAALAPIPTWYFAVVVVRLGHRVLLVEEQDGKGWYFPGGQITDGETMEGAALHKAQQDAGIPIVLEGMLRVEHGVGQGGVRVRVFYVARPRDDTTPKATSDQYSVRAAWATVRDLDRLKLRGDEVRDVVEHVMGGGPVYPLNVWVLERTPWQ